jgi:hypothetical protein
LVRNMKGSCNGCQYWEWGVGTRHQSPAQYTASRITYRARRHQRHTGYECQRRDQIGPGNATAAKAASELSSTTQPKSPSLYDIHLSSAEPEKPIHLSARNHSPFPPHSSVPLQSPINQQDHSGVTHSRSEELDCISPPDAIGKRWRRW